MIKYGTCSFTTISYLKELLLKENFTELNETSSWNLDQGNYFIIRNDASLIAFKIKEKRKAFHIISTHCDTPSFLLKPQGVNIKSKFIKYNVMPYGGLLNYGWLDHPLSLAGRVFLKNNDTLIKKIVDFRDPLAVIPSVAIHQNANANSNLDLNAQVDLQPIFGLGCENKDWYKLITEKIKPLKNEVIEDFDLFLYNPTSPVFFGDNEEILLSPRIDNITSVSASFEAFMESDPKEVISVFCTFNNEEIGSVSKEGADSNFLLDVLKRIAASLDIDIQNTFAKSFIISSDNTHGVHPNHEEYKDDTGSAYLGDGFTIVREPESTTNAYFSSLLKMICDKKKIKYQYATSKNDIVGGSTLSGISLKHVSVTTIDVGIPQLAMHSSIEVCNFDDYISLYQMMKTFYNISFQIKKERTEIIF